MGVLWRQSNMKLTLLFLTCWLASTQGYDNGMESYMGTCLDPMDLSQRFLGNSPLLNDMQEAVDACMDFGERKGKKKPKKKKGKEEEKPSKNKSKKSSKKPSKKGKEEEKPKKKKSKGKGKGKEEEEEKPNKNKSKKKSKGKKGKEEEEEKPSKKKSKKKQKKKPKKKPTTTTTLPPCQTFEEMLDYFDDAACVMEFMGWSDNNGTLNETMIYNDVMDDTLLSLFYDDIYGSCMMDMENERSIGDVVEDRCIGDYTEDEMFQIEDLMETMSALDCWQSFVDEALLVYTRMVLGIPSPVFTIFGGNSSMT